MCDCSKLKNLIEELRLLERNSFLSNQEKLKRLIVLKQKVSLEIVRDLGSCEDKKELLSLLRAFSLN